jgi:hypothetical protein
MAVNSWKGTGTDRKVHGLNSIPLLGFLAPKEQRTRDDGKMTQHNGRGHEKL